MLKRDKLIEEIENGIHDDQYSNYIIENCGGERIICNGDTLIEAIESGYLFEEFSEYMLECRCLK